MRKWFVCLIVFTAIVTACGPSQTNTPTPVPDVGGETVDEATEEVTEEAAEPTEAADEATEEATGDEATEEATEAVADEATEEAAGDEATEESTETVAGDEATEESPTEVAQADETEEATEEVEPTEAPAEEATDEATREVDTKPTEVAMALDTTFTSDDGSISFMYPGDLFVSEESGQIILASSEDAAAATDDMPASGEFRAAIAVSAVTDMDLALSTGATPVEVLQALADALVAAGVPAGASDTSGDEATEEADATDEPDASTEDMMTFEEPEEMSVGTHDAARMIGKRGDGDIAIWAIDLGDDVFAVIFAATASGELADFEPTLTAIAESITYTPMDAEADADATEEATEQAGG
jgi:hypothetical protein